MVTTTPVSSSKFWKIPNLLIIQFSKKIDTKIQILYWIKLSTNAWQNFRQQKFQFSLEPDWSPHALVKWTFPDSPQYRGYLFLKGDELFGYQQPPKGTSLISSRTKMLESLDIPSWEKIYYPWEFTFCHLKLLYTSLDMHNVVNFNPWISTFEQSNRYPLDLYILNRFENGYFLEKPNFHNDAIVSFLI